MILKNHYHFSIDDVFDCLIEITDKNIPLFNHPLLKYLKAQHEQFGVSIGLNVFYQKIINGKLRTLREVLVFKKELAKSPWLFFGPHALDYETPPYVQSEKDQIKTFDKIYKEIDRFAGKNTHSKYVRLQYYSESFELANYFHKKNVLALFTTDRERGTHEMPNNIGTELLKKGFAKFKGMNFIRTQFRVEFFRDEKLKKRGVFNRLRQALTKYGFLVFYTHEIDLQQKPGQEMARLMLEQAEKLNLKSIKKT